MENIKITNTDLTNTIYSDLLNWQYNSQVTTDSKIDYFKFKNENDLVFSDVWKIKMTDEGLSMNDQLVYLYRKAYNRTLNFNSNLTCKQTLSYLREDPYNVSMTYKFRRKDNPDNVFERTFCGYGSSLVDALTVSGDEAVKFYQENDEYNTECKIEGVGYGGGWFGRITDDTILEVSQVGSRSWGCLAYKMPGTTASDNTLPDVNSTSYDLTIPFTIDASFLNVEDGGDGWFKLTDINSTLISYSSINSDNNSLGGKNFVKILIYNIDYSSSSRNTWWEWDSFNEEDGFNNSSLIICKPFSTTFYDNRVVNISGENYFLEVFPDDLYSTYFVVDEDELGTSTGSNTSGWTYCVRSGSDTDLTHSWIVVCDSSSMDYDFDLTTSPNNTYFRHYNHSISSSLTNSGAAINTAVALYPGCYREKDLTIKKSNSQAVVAGHIKVKNLLISNTSNSAVETTTYRSTYVIHNPYPVALKVMYSSRINKYDFDMNNGRDYFRDLIWPQICANCYFNATILNYGGSQHWDSSLITLTELTINPYSTASVDVDLITQFSSAIDINNERYFVIAYSLDNVDNPFRYSTCIYFTGTHRFEEGSVRTFNLCHYMYSLPANSMLGNNSLVYRAVHTMATSSINFYEDTDSFSFWPEYLACSIDVEELESATFNSNVIQNSTHQVSVGGKVPSHPTITSITNSSGVTFPGYVVWYVKADQESTSIANGVTSLMWDHSINRYYFSINSKLPSWYNVNSSYTYRLYYLYGILGQGTRGWKSTTLTKQ